MDARWFEVFKAGKYPQGDVSKADVEHIARTYDPSWREAPVVLGHPKTDDPAFGWVAAVKAQAGRLFVQFRDLAGDFVKAVRAKRFSRVSIRILRTPERGMYLGHVGFLGAALPAVAGLEPIKFEQGDVEALDVEMEFTTAAGEAAEEQGMVDQKKKDGASPAGQDFQAQLDAMRADFEKKLADQQADYERKAEEREGKLREQLTGERRERELAEFRHELEGKVRDGKLAPALLPGLAEFAVSLPDGDDQAIEFTTDGEAAKKSPRQFFRDFLDQLPGAVEFGAAAGSDSDPGASRRTDFKDIDLDDGTPVDDAAADLHRKALEYREKHPQASYVDAVNAVR